MKRVMRRIRENAAEPWRRVALQDVSVDMRKLKCFIWITSWGAL